MDFKQIEAFVNVVKYQGFSKAADASFLTQPTISTHIRNLEKELEVRLIDRNNKAMQLTSQGRIFYEYALELLNKREEAIVSLQRHAQKIDGVVELQASSVPGQYIVPQLMAGFRARHEMARFYLEQSDSHQVEENLLNQKGEIGFTGSMSHNRLQYEPLVEDEVVLITPKNKKFLEREGETLRIEDFIDEPFAWREHGSATRTEFEAMLSDLGIYNEQMKVVFRSNSMAAIKRAVASGLCISIISRMAVGNEDFLCFDIKEFCPNRKFYLVYHKDITLSPTAEKFKNYALSVYSKEKDEIPGTAAHKAMLREIQGKAGA